MFQHTVLWKMKGESSDERQELAQEFVNLLLNLENKVPGILELRASVNNANQSEFAWDVSLFTAFRSEDDFQEYQIHPDHQKVVAWLKGRASDRAVVDSEF